MLIDESTLISSCMNAYMQGLHQQVAVKTKPIVTKACWSCNPLCKSLMRLPFYTTGVTPYGRYKHSDFSNLALLLISETRRIVSDAAHDGP